MTTRRPARHTVLGLRPTPTARVLATALLLGWLGVASNCTCDVTAMASASRSPNASAAGGCGHDNGFSPTAIHSCCGGTVSSIALDATVIPRPDAILPAWSSSAPTVPQPSMHAHRPSAEWHRAVPRLFLLHSALLI